MPIQIRLTVFFSRFSFFVLVMVISLLFVAQCFDFSPFLDFLNIFFFIMTIPLITFSHFIFISIILSSF